MFDREPLNLIKSTNIHKNAMQRLKSIRKSRLETDDGMIDDNTPCFVNPDKKTLMFD
mgnify:CR=1 FL=1